MLPGCSCWRMLLTTILVARRGVLGSRIQPAAFVSGIQQRVQRSTKISTNHRQRSPFVSLAATNMEAPTTKARIVSSDQLQECGDRIRRGELVAFPTETVYGLGCNALDPVAVQKVFSAKERPLTDPLIVHVNTAQEALQLWHSDNKALLALTTTFWPGPLTIVARAAPNVPSILMANTGFVACRSPSHPLARQLIDCAKVPIAAPSANKFGHVSPTRASHVWDDLKGEDVWIVDAPHVCDVGVESTVAKVMDSGEVTVLRQGAISVEEIAACLQQAGLNNAVDRDTERAVQEHVATVAPGQTIRHYSPNIPSFIVASAVCTASLSEDDRVSLRTSILLDFGGQLKTWEDTVLAYRDLSTTGDSAEAARNVFDALRWAELIDGGSRILFPELPSVVGTDALTLALKDRLTRAASGVVIGALR
jgi:L-threonylcarbamoyladenylate synthase